VGLTGAKPSCLREALSGRPYGRRWTSPVGIGVDRAWPGEKEDGEGRTELPSLGEDMLTRRKGRVGGQDRGSLGEACRCRLDLGGALEQTTHQTQLELEGRGAVENSGPRMKEGICLELFISSEYRKRIRRVG
jgi:hypothetical protein